MRDGRRCLVASVQALNSTRLCVPAAHVMSLSSQIAQELNQVLGNLHGANGEEHATNGDLTQTQQVSTNKNPRNVKFSITKDSI